VNMIFFFLFSSISPSKVDSYNVLLVVCLGGTIVFGLVISTGYPNFL